MKYKENASKSSLENFPSNRYEVSIIWKTKKVKNLFFLKDKNQIYKKARVVKIMSAKQSEMLQLDATRWAENENVNHNSEPAKHLKENTAHKDVS